MKILLPNRMMADRQGIGESAIASAALSLENLPRQRLQGRVREVSGLLVRLEGLAPWLQMGSQVALAAPGGDIRAEVVAFAGGLAAAMAFGPLEGVGPGTPAVLLGPAGLPVSPGWLGRVVDPLGQPLDGRGPLPPGPRAMPRRAAAPNAGTRARLGPRLNLGVRALDAFATCRRGQRLGLFAASGVGKSTLLAMLARGAECDVCVLALVGERGRELREFIEDDLGPEGMARSVVVCATSDAPPLLRREAAPAALAVAEHFAAQGLHVLLLMDSLTRYAMAQREIALAIGEPPATKGYPPSCFAKLPQLVERSGNGLNGVGSITAFYTVLSEGDDRRCCGEAHKKYPPFHSITSSARARIDGGRVRPSALAVFMVTTSATLVGCSTGRSAGFAPLRMRST